MCNDDVIDIDANDENLIVLFKGVETGIMLRIGEAGAFTIVVDEKGA